MTDTFKIKRILFVCTGNICRSPMAEAILTKALAEHSKSGKYAADSAGIYAETGCRPTRGAQRALERIGIFDFTHLAKQVTRDMLLDSHLVLCMSEWHTANIKELCPDCSVHTIKEYIGGSGEVADPYGGDDDVYYNTALELERLISALIKKL